MLENCFSIRKSSIYEIRNSYFKSIIGPAPPAAKSQNVETDDSILFQICEIAVLLESTTESSPRRGQCGQDRLLRPAHVRTALRWCSDMWWVGTGIFLVLCLSMRVVEVVSVRLRSELCINSLVCIVVLSLCASKSVPERTL